MREELNEGERAALSAWYDGEGVGTVPTPESAEGQRLAAYRAMTSAIGSLPQPDVHPAFRTRVMAAVREEAAAPRGVSIAWRWVALAGLSAVVLAVAATGGWLSSGSAPTERIADVTTTPVAPVRSNEDFYRHLATLPAAELAALVPADFEPEDDAGPMAALDAESLQTVQAMGVVVEAQADFGELLNSLDSEEKAQFKRLLIASVSED